MRAQTEIIGLLVIFIIATMALLIGIILMKPTAEKSYEQVFRYSQLPINFLLTLANSYFDNDACPGQTYGTFAELAKKCAEKVGYMYCNGQHVCTFLQDELRSIVEKMLNFTIYRFNFTALGTEEFSFSNEAMWLAASPRIECIEWGGEESYIMPIEGGIAELKLQLCNKQLIG